VKCAVGEGLEHPLAPGLLQMGDKVVEKEMVVALLTHHTTIIEVR
jgi:hypothetical protein